MPYAGIPISQASAFATAAQGVKADTAHALTTGAQPLDAANVNDRSVIIVAGFGTAAVNGTYTRGEDYGGRATYISGANAIVWETDHWVIYGDGTDYLSYNDVATPDLATTWEVASGSEPIGTVTASRTTLSVVADKANTALQPFADVATNAAKLALTDISAGYTVRVTGEANRIEMFTGGDPSSNANWQIIGPNTFNLHASKTGGVDPWSVNGVVVVGTDPDNPTTIGWVREGEKLTIEGQNTENLSKAAIRYIDGQNLYGYADNDLPLILQDSYMWTFIPYRLPNREEAVVIELTVDTGE